MANHTVGCPEGLRRAHREGISGTWLCQGCIVHRHCQIVAPTVHDHAWPGEIGAGVTGFPLNVGHSRSVLDFQSLIPEALGSARILNGRACVHFHCLDTVRGMVLHEVDLTHIVLCHRDLGQVGLVGQGMDTVDLRHLRADMPMHSDLDSVVAKAIYPIYDDIPYFDVVDFGGIEQLF